MPERQLGTPLLIEDGEARALERVPFGEKTYDERWLQEFLFEHPALIPVAELEPIFDGLVPVCCELPTAAEG